MKQFFKTLWTKWKKNSHYIADFQSRLILTFFYFIIALPFGLFGTYVVDPLGLRRPPSNSNWQKREATEKDLESARNQF